MLKIGYEFKISKNYSFRPYNETVKIKKGSIIRIIDIDYQLTIPEKILVYFESLKESYWMSEWEINHIQNI